MNVLVHSSVLKYFKLGGFKIGVRCNPTRRDTVRKQTQQQDWYGLADADRQNWREQKKHPQETLT